MTTATSSRTFETTALAARTLGADDEAWFKAGEAMLTEGLQVGRDFCSKMIGISSGAIPIYIGVLKLELPENHVFLPWEAVVVLIPPALFLIAAIAFFLGYFPRKVRFDYIFLHSIPPAYYATTKVRYDHALFGSNVFLLALVAAVGVTLFVF